MKIGFMGAGKVGTAFGLYLSQRGLELSGYYSRSAAAAALTAEYTASRCFLSPEELVLNSDIIFITTGDSQIEAACKELSSTGLLRPQHTLLHMSGALPSAVLESAKALGCSTLSMHPLISVADACSASAFEAAVFFIEGDAASVEKISPLLNKLGNKYNLIDSKDKALYHAAACMFSNYLTALIDNGLSVLEAIGIDKSFGFKAVRPLIESTLENIESFGAEKALTGPIARGDASTVAAHIDAFDKLMPQGKEFYCYMGQHALRLAARDKLKDEQKKHELKEILSGGANNEG